jgi:prolyl oligopeptidase
MADMLRMELAPDGAAGVPEFGTAMKKNQFSPMIVVSPYHQVHDGVAYPAVLLTSDDRAAAWQSAKLAARLQSATDSGKPVMLRVDDVKSASARAHAIAETADAWSFFLWQAGMPGFQPKP